MNSRILLSSVAVLAMMNNAIAEEKHDHDEKKSQEAHVHGKSELNIAIEGTRVVVELESPGNDIVGFEHAAETQEDKAAVKKALAVLEKPLALFAPPADAGCTLTESEAEFETDGEHAGFHVHWTMECTTPKALNSLSVTFFDQFPAAEEVEVQAISDGGQTGIELHHDDKTIDLSAIVG